MTERDGSFFPHETASSVMIMRNASWARPRPRTGKSGGPRSYPAPHPLDDRRLCLRSVFRVEIVRRQHQRGVAIEAKPPRPIAMLMVRSPPSCSAHDAAARSTSASKSSSSFRGLFCPQKQLRLVSPTSTRRSIRSLTQSGFRLCSLRASTTKRRTSFARRIGFPRIAQDSPVSNIRGP